MFGKVLIANRGEIAVRVARTCRELGIKSVAVFSDPDSDARHVAAADESVHLPGRAPTDTYLRIDTVLAAARQTGAEAIHPGYGFLSENASFADAVINAGLAWVGPPAEVLRSVGDKIEARRIAESAGVPVVPGLLDPIEEHGAAAAFASDHGWPIAIKAAGGGGGRGLKVARSEADLESAFESARREARAYFGDERVYVERYLDAPKHLEVQVLAPRGRQALWLGVRDCSFQRRHQKLIEETPPPLFAERASAIGDAAVALAKAAGYENAGTVEFLVDESGDFYFLEVNARLQVEHTVTEEVYGIDLVACQLQIAAGDALSLQQADLTPRGHAIECRINAEDPRLGFAPGPGRLDRFEPPGGSGIRVDAGYATGDTIPSEYDSLIAKLVTWGEDREQSRRRMLQALRDMVIDGVPSTVDAHLLLLESDAFKRGTHTTRTIDEENILKPLEEVGDAPRDVLMVRGRPVALWNPAMARSASAAVHAVSAASGDVLAPMQGTVLKVLVTEGDSVEAGAPVVIVEAMKMETTVAASRSGSVARLQVASGDTVAAGQVLAIIE
ncbi:MAG TPA: biotin carboxylase N-terminal domain-containing protein [Actinomycetota bacterium]|nr:biotin carboxylase N-terminal domain-containing protein [Actinomycetota bacterium]